MKTLIPAKLNLFPSLKLQSNDLNFLIIFLGRDTYNGYMPSQSRQKILIDCRLLAIRKLLDRVFLVWIVIMVRQQHTQFWLQMLVNVNIIPPLVLDPGNIPREGMSFGHSCLFVRTLVSILIHIQTIGGIIDLVRKNRQKIENLLIYVFCSKTNSEICW